MPFNVPMLRTKNRARHYTPLYRRVVAVNAIVLLLTCVMAVLVVTPGLVPSLALGEALILVVALLCLFWVNLLLLRGAFGPLEQLTELTRRIDLSRPGKRLPLKGPRSEASELAEAFNEMLARLEAEQQESTRRVLSAQEAERLRTAQELHDEVGQTLTAALLSIERTGKHGPAQLEPDLAETRETVRASLESVRRIARELRPEALDDLGLTSALAALADRLSGQGGLKVRFKPAEDVAAMSAEAELVVYRIAQESLTNVLRHSGATEADLRLESAPDRNTLLVVDNGSGFSLDSDANGTGIRGMRERAALIGADLSIFSRPSEGTKVRLDVPLLSEGLWYR